MTQDLEWGSVQQIVLLIRNGGLGFILGVLLDVISGASRYKSKRSRFCLDALFGAFAAVVTFFCDLVLTGGKLHPITYLGIAFGMILEHITVGKWVNWLAYRLVRMVRNIKKKLRSLFCASSKKLCSALRRNSIFCVKNQNNSEKTRKKLIFFKKKS